MTPVIPNYNRHYSEKALNSNKYYNNAYNKALDWTMFGLLKRKNRPLQGEITYDEILDRKPADYNRVFK